MFSLIVRVFFLGFVILSAQAQNQKKIQARPNPNTGRPNPNPGQPQVTAPRQILIASPGAAAAAAAAKASLAAKSATSISPSTQSPAAPTANLIPPARQKGRAPAKAADAAGTDVPAPVGVDEPAATSVPPPPAATSVPPPPAATSTSAPQPQPSPSPPANQPNVVSNKNAIVDPRTITVVAADGKANPFAAQTAGGSRLFSVTQKGGKITATGDGAGVTGRYCCLSKAKTSICTAKQKNCRVENNIAKCGSLDANPNPVQNSLSFRRAIRKSSVTNNPIANANPARNTAGNPASPGRATAGTPTNNASPGNKISADEPFAFENPQLTDLPACIAFGVRGSETASSNARGLVLEAA